MEENSSFSLWDSASHGPQGCSILGRPHHAHCHLLLELSSCGFLELLVRRILKGGRTQPKLEFCLSTELGFDSVTVVGICFVSCFDFSWTPIAVKNTTSEISALSV